MGGRQRAPDGRDWRDDTSGPLRDDGPAAGGAGLDSLWTSPMLRWMGAMATRTALLVLVAAALIGVVLTLITGHDPGFILGFFVVIGAIVAILGVRRGAIYLFFPLPALLLFLASLMIGAVHDRGLESAGTAGVSAGFLQWVAAAFFPMCIATVVTLVLGGGRWLLGRQLVTGSFTAPPRGGHPGPPGPAGPSGPRPGPRRPASGGSWPDDAPRSARPGYRGPAQDGPGQNGTGQNGTGPRRAGAGWQDGRAPRDQRTSRDPWGDPRLPSPPPADPRTRPAPQFQPHDRTASRPAQGDRTAPRPAPGDPWDSSARPARPPRPPRDPRDQR